MCTIDPAQGAATIYVDKLLAADCVETYAARERTCGRGSDTAYRTLNAGLQAAQPGDTVLIRAGMFREHLVPPRSGTATARITIRSSPGEVVILTGFPDAPTLMLKSRSHLVIEGLTVSDALGWGRIEDSANNVLRNNRFAAASAHGTTGGLKFVRSSQNRIEGNTISDGHDNLVLQDSNHNLVLNNSFSEARHSLLSLRCSSYNVVRGNTFSNLRQKAAEIYDCEAVSDAPFKLDASKRNLVEGNAFVLTRGSSADYRYNGIQYAGQQGIVRHNVFYDNRGGGLSFQVYASEALHNYGHRIYNNTFFNNRCSGLNASAGRGAERYVDNLVRNNVFYKNVDCAGAVGQVSIGNPGAVILRDNAILESAPGFMNEAERDLRPAPGSTLVDSGSHVARTMGAGEGSRLPVSDVLYFYDGFGIAGEVGDLIQLEGGGRTARVVSIDYAAKVLVLDAALSWKDRQGVHLAYSGARPDLGAFELGGGAGPRARPTPDSATHSR